MKVKEGTLWSILNARPLEVPPFQRRYAWKERNFAQLWEDIEAVLEGRRKHHFMCTVVFQQNGPSRLTVIDGQQRLITFMIILRVLYDVALLREQTKAHPVKRFFENKVKCFLSPSRQDRAAFDSLLDSPKLLDKSPDHRHFKECYDFFFARVDGYMQRTVGQKKALFDRVYAAIVEKMGFVRILLADDDDTHAIFETINNSGVPLTAADLARNLILSRGKTEADQARLNETYWEPLEAMFTSCVNGRTKSARKIEVQTILPEFLRCVLVVERKRHVGSTELFRELRLYFQPKELENNLRVMTEHAQMFCRLLNPDREPNRLVRAQLDRLLDLRMTTYHPVLLVLFRAYKTKAFSAPNLVKAMQYIESFIVRRAFNSKVSRDLPKVFAKIATELSTAKRCASLHENLSALLSNNGWPDNEVFSACFRSTPIYAQAPAAARLVLIRLEQAHKNANELNLDGSIHIEHIFPQSPNSADWDADLTDLKKRLHVIGNLTLSEKSNNQSLGNRCFAQKRDGANGYARSPYWLSNTLKKKKTWTGADVDARGGTLLKDALKLWPHVG